MEQTTSFAQIVGKGFDFIINYRFTLQKSMTGVVQVQLFVTSVEKHFLTEKDWWHIPVLHMYDPRVIPATCVKRYFIKITSWPNICKCIQGPSHGSVTIVLTDPIGEIMSLFTVEKFISWLMHIWLEM